MWVSVFLISVSTLTVFFIRYRFKENRRFLIFIFLAALLVRVIGATALYLYSLHVGAGGTYSGDESVYFKRAVNIALSRSLHSKNIFDDTPELDEPTFALNLFSIFASILVSQFGQSLLLIKYFNAFIGALLPVVIFLLAKLIFESKSIAKISAVLAAFWPSLIAWSSLGYKEQSIILILSAIFYLYLKNQRKFSFLYFILIIVLAVALFNLQPYIAPLIMMIFITRFIYMKLFRRINRRINKKLLALIIIIISNCAFFLNQKHIGYVLYRIAEHQVTQYLAGDYNSARYELYPGVRRAFFFDFYDHFTVPEHVFNSMRGGVEGTRYVTNNIVEIKWKSFLGSYCKGLAYALFAPFLWSIKSGRQLMMYPQVAFWWMIFPFIIYGIIWSLKFKRGDTISIISFIISVYSVLALTEGNIGSVFRHRDWVTPLCLIFGVVGIIRFSELFLKSNQRV